jgi:hypothetical protein
MKLAIGRLLLIAIAFLQLSALPTMSQSPEKIFGGLLGIMEKKIRKEEERQRRRSRRQRPRRMEAPKIVNREGLHDSGLRNLPSIQGVKLEDSYTEYELRRKFRMRCSTSSTYNSMRWCSGKARKKGRRGRFTISTTALIDENDKIRYLNREYVPAYFSRGEMVDDIAKVAARNKNEPIVFSARTPNRYQAAKIAIWGRLELEELGENNYTALRNDNSPKRGVLLDYMNRMYRSARMGMPVYALTSGQAFVWVGQKNESGRGVLRFFLIDASFLASNLHDNAARTSSVDNRNVEGNREAIRSSNREKSEGRVQFAGEEHSQRTTKEATEAQRRRADIEKILAENRKLKQLLADKSGDQKLDEEADFNRQAAEEAKRLQGQESKSATEEYKTANARTYLSTDRLDAEIMAVMQEYNKGLHAEGNPNELTPRQKVRLRSSLMLLKPRLEQKFIGMDVQFGCKLAKWQGSGAKRIYRSPVTSHLYNRKRVLVKLPGANFPEVGGDEVFGVSCSPIILPNVQFILPVAYDRARLQRLHKMDQNNLMGKWQSEFSRKFDGEKKFRFHSQGVNLYKLDEIRIRGTVEFAEITGSESAVLALADGFSYKLQTDVVSRSASNSESEIKNTQDALEVAMVGIWKKNLEINICQLKQALGIHGDCKESFLVRLQEMFHRKDEIRKKADIKFKFKYSMKGNCTLIQSVERLDSPIDANRVPIGNALRTWRQEIDFGKIAQLVRPGNTRVFPAEKYIIVQVSAEDGLTRGYGTAETFDGRSTDLKIYIKDYLAGRRRGAESHYDFMFIVDRPHSANSVVYLTLGMIKRKCA